MILPGQFAKFPARGPSEIEARAVIGTPFQRVCNAMPDIAMANFGGAAAAYSYFAAAASTGIFALDNPGLSYFDLAVLGVAAPAGTNTVRVYGAIDIPGGKRTAPIVEKQFDPGTVYANTLGAMIVPLFDPNTGLQDITFSATPDISDSLMPYYFTSGNKYVYCAGVDRVYAILTSGTGLDANAANMVLMGRFVG